MKLAAIYNVWDGYELLEGSIEQIREHVDKVYVVWQTISNFGQVDHGFSPLLHDLEARGLVDASLHIEPPKGQAPYKIETYKRELGITLAREEGCTHYMLMDCDEYYNPLNFELSLDAYRQNPNVVTYANILVYYKKPTLRFEKHDETVAPLFCPIEFSRMGGTWKGLLADRTRRPVVPSSDYIQKSPIDMHHFSWVRNDIRKKVENSTARNNINRPDILRDYEKAEAGYYVRSIYSDTLIEVPDYFGLESRLNSVSLG